jgi:hypothetical protein
MTFKTSFSKIFGILLNVRELFQVVSLICNIYFLYDNCLNIQPLDHFLLLDGELS